MTDEFPPPADPQLDTLLSEWFFHGEPTPSQSRELCEQIVDRCVTALRETESTADAESTVTFPVSSPRPAATMRAELTPDPANRGTRRRTTLRPRFAEFAVCATLLLTVVGLWWSPLPEVSRPALETSLESLHDTAEGQARLLHACQDLFADQLAWVADSQSQTEVGLRESPSSDAVDPLGIRVALARRKRGSRNWNLVWTTDIVTTSSQPVRPEKAVADARLGDVNPISELWAYRLPDGLVYVESRVRFDPPRSNPEQSIGLLEPDQPTLVARVNANGDEYRLYHTVADLAAKDLSR